MGCLKVLGPWKGVNIGLGNDLVPEGTNLQTEPIKVHGYSYEVVKTFQQLNEFITTLWVNITVTP